MQDGTLKVARIEDKRPAPVATHTISYVLDGFSITTTLETTAPIADVIARLKALGAQPGAQPTKAAAVPSCPEHGTSKPSKKPGSYYCPKSLPDGGYCRWTGKA